MHYATEDKKELVASFFNHPDSEIEFITPTNCNTSSTTNTRQNILRSPPSSITPPLHSYDVITDTENNWLNCVSKLNTIKEENLSKKKPTFSFLTIGDFTIRLKLSAETKPKLELRRSKRILDIMTSKSYHDVVNGFKIQT